MSVGSEIPDAAVAQRDIYLARLGRYGVACGIGDFAVNAASEGRTIGERQRQFRVAAYEDGVFQLLADGIERSLVGGSLPPVGTYGEKHFCEVVVHQLNTVESDDGVGIGDVDEMVLTVLQCTAVHGEVRVAAGCIARERLVYHNGILKLCMNVALGVADGQLAVVQRDAVLTLDDSTLQHVRYENSIAHGDISRRVDDGRAWAVAGIAATFDGHGAAIIITIFFKNYYAVNLYLFGVIPVRDLNRREKCCRYSKPSW